MIKFLKYYLQSIFCIHDYEMPEDVDDHKERDRLVAELKEGESIAFSRLHVCTKCNKEQMLGSGMIC